MAGSHQASTSPHSPHNWCCHYTWQLLSACLSFTLCMFLQACFISKLLSLFLPGRVTSGSSLQKQVLPKRRVQVSFKEAPACPKTSQPYNPSSLPQSHILSHHPPLPDPVLLLLVCWTPEAAARGFWSKTMVHVRPNESQRFQRAWPRVTVEIKPSVSTSSEIHKLIYTSHTDNSCTEYSG